MTISFKKEVIDDESIKKLEQLRYDAYGMIVRDISYDETYYAKELKKNKYLVCTAYCDEQLIGACYVSNSFNSIYIEQLFVSKSFQKSGLEIGKNLLSYVLSNKKYIENYFNGIYNKSYLSASNYYLEKYYEKLGYKKIDDNYMKKSI